MELQPPVGVIVEFVTSEQVSQAEITRMAQALNAEILRLDVDAVEPEVGQAASEVRQLLITLAPAVIEPLLGLLKSWCKRHEAIGVCLKLKVGRKIINLGDVPQEVTPEQVSALVREMQQP